MEQSTIHSTLLGKMLPFSLTIIFFSCINLLYSQGVKPSLSFVVSIPQPGSHTYQVEFTIDQWNQDTIRLKMPKWMPGYYQIMDYSKNIESISAADKAGKIIPIETINNNTWKLKGIKNKLFTLSYTVKTSRQFVAISYVDSAHAYLIPESTFLYVDGFLQSPAIVKIKMNPQWKHIATGLEPVLNKSNEFLAPDFDILYDCPFLIGNLESLPSFTVGGIEHKFVGYKIGEFDKVLFIENLKKIVEASVDIIGDIPFKQYTFITIGPGRGGIEHLNNTTVSFDGSNLNKPDAMNRMMNFLAHEYFHHYNVKRIRPFELGPFDYDKGSATNLLWVSEGLSVYYEYLIVKRAGLADDNTLFSNFNENINSVENNPGRLFQSLQQSSYSTWKDGPFGTQGDTPGRTISYYIKGPIVGMLLDFEIRHTTENKKSLDDVMRLLYWKYYRQEHRGFTDAEFQRACESVAGTSLSSVFEYVYTTKELDYDKYLAYAGLKIDRQTIDSDEKAKKLKLSISRIANPDSLQLAILNSWLGAF